MSYVVQSSDNTVKVIVNSQLATHGTASRPMFTLKTPIETPYNQTGLVNLESIAIRAPSMFTPDLLNDERNSITTSTLLEAADAYVAEADGSLTDTTAPVASGEPDIIIQGPSGTYQEVNGNLPTYESSREIQPAEQYRFKQRFGIGQYLSGNNLYFKGVNKGFDVYDPDLFMYTDAATSGLTNQYSMRAILLSCNGTDMSIAANTATLLFNIVNQFRVFEIVFLPLNNGAAFTGTGVNIFQQVTLSWNSTSSRTVLKVNNVEQSTTTYTDAAIKTLLTTMLTNATHYTFSLAVPDTNTAKYILRGPWLKLLGIELDEGYYHVLDKYNDLKCTLQSNGYDFVNMCTNFSRAVYAANQQSEDWQIVPTNIFWTINIVSEPGKYTYYDNMSSSGKIPFNMPIMDEIEVYFTDKYGDIIDDIREFTCILTFDFCDKQIAKEAMTTKRARRTLAMF